MVNSSVVPSSLTTSQTVNVTKSRGHTTKSKLRLISTKLHPSPRFTMFNFPQHNCLCISKMHRLNLVRKLIMVVCHSPRVLKWQRSTCGHLEMAPHLSPRQVSRTALWNTASLNMDLKMSPSRPPMPRAVSPSHWSSELKVSKHILIKLAPSISYWELSIFTSWWLSSDASHLDLDAIVRSNDFEPKIMFVLSQIFFHLSTFPSVPIALSPPKLWPEPHFFPVSARVHTHCYSCNDLALSISHIIL